MASNHSDGPNYYGNLGIVDLNCSQNTIRSHYKLLAMKYHPDRNRHNSAMTEKFQKIQQAYSVLHGPAQRSVYDQIRSKGMPILANGSTSDTTEDYHAYP